MTATIIATIDVFNVREEKQFTGTEDEIYAEALDFMNEVVLHFIERHNVTNVDDQYYIADQASHTIVWSEYKPSMKTAFAVYDTGGVYGVYATRADAEEAILHECDTWAYEIMMTEDPDDFMGALEWDWAGDYHYLLHDAGRTFFIQEVPIYDMKVIK